MKNLLLSKLAFLNDSRVKFVLMLGLLVSLLLLSSHVFATDLLLNTDKDIKDTITGTGRKWLIWIDGAISLGAFIYTKKPVVFFSVLGVCLFITALVNLAGTAPTV
jgi:hypothetical protein